MLGKEISSDELSTSTATGELARNMDTAYVTGEEAFLAAKPAQRSYLLGWVYTAERVRSTVAEIPLPGTNGAVTVSIGVAVFPDHASTADRLERLADAALYTAKRHGRNRVELAEPMATDTTADVPEQPTYGTAAEPVPTSAATGG